MDPDAPPLLPDTRIQPPALVSVVNGLLVVVALTALVSIRSTHILTTVRH